MSDDKRTATKETREKAARDEAERARSDWQTDSRGDVYYKGVATYHYEHEYGRYWQEKMYEDLGGPPGWTSRSG